MRTRVVVAGIALAWATWAPTAAHAECEQGVAYSQRYVAGLHFSYSKALGGEDSPASASRTELGLRLWDADVSCDSPVIVGYGVDVGAGLLDWNRWDGVRAALIGHATVGHSPPFGLEIGIGGRLGGVDPGWFIYVGAYVSLWYAEGGARYEWGLGEGRPSRAYYEGFVHVPFDGSGPRKF